MVSTGGDVSHPRWEEEEICYGLYLIFNFSLFYSIVNIILIIYI
jgi:hypothetical protein